MNGIRVPFLALILLHLSICHAQISTVVRGNVEAGAALEGNDKLAELEALDHSSPKLQSSVGGDGSFEFRQTPPGWYILRLTTSMGASIAEQTVSVPQSSPLTIRLPQRASTSRPISGTVSAQRLLHPVPAKAFRAFEQAQRESETGRPLEAIRKLEQAVSLYPDYFEARSNLGTLYSRQGRNAEALQQFEKAVSTGPASAPLYGNLAYSLYLAGRLSEAEDAARGALNLDSSFPPAHYLLGSLLAKGKNSREAIRHLRLGMAVTPKAHLELAKVYVADNDRAAAMEEVRLYLNSGDTTYRTEAQRWLAVITGP